VTVTALFVNDDFRRKSGRLSVARLAVTLLLVGCSGQAREEPNDVPVTAVDDIANDVDVFDFGDVQEPPVPYVGGDGLDVPLDDESFEFDCVDAEELCESGIYPCDDIADFCDIGPDDLGELPDEYDWDGG